MFALPSLFFFYKKGVLCLCSLLSFYFILIFLKGYGVLVCTFYLSHWLIKKKGSVVLVLHFLLSHCLSKKKGSTVLVCAS